MCDDDGDAIEAGRDSHRDPGISNPELVVGGDTFEPSVVADQRRRVSCLDRIEDVGGAIPEFRAVGEGFEFGVDTPAATIPSDRQVGLVQVNIARS